MRLHSRVRDCLFLNWALPFERVPPPPAPLRREVHDPRGEPRVLVSAVCLRQQGSHLDALPSIRIGFPQFNVRSYVTDGDGVPAVLFHQMLVPVWAWLPVRWVARQPVEAATLDAPPAGSPAPWLWQVGGPSGFACRVEPGAPPVIEDIFGGWSDVVESVSCRDRGYVHTRPGHRRLLPRQPGAGAVPWRARILAATRVERLFGGEPLPALHSAFLCPDLPLVLELEREPPSPMVSRAPAPG